jgi:hypothetical protein
MRKKPDDIGSKAKVEGFQGRTGVTAALGWSGGNAWIGTDKVETANPRRCRARHSRYLSFGAAGQPLATHPGYSREKWGTRDLCPAMPRPLRGRRAVRSRPAIKRSARSIIPEGASFSNAEQADTSMRGPRFFEHTL